MAKAAAIPFTRQAHSSREGKPTLSEVGNIAVKCVKCKEILYSRDWEKNLKVCSRCNYHFRLTAYERIELLADPGSFSERDADIISVDPLQFSTFPPSYSDQRNYAEKSPRSEKSLG